MDDIDTCSIRGHEYGSLLNERGGHICLNCGHVDEDYERPDEWRENDWDGWDEDAPNSLIGIETDNGDAAGSRRAGRGES